MAKFVTIGERIHCISPAIRRAMAERDPEPILKRAKEQLDAGATYLDVNIGPAENDGEDLMKWAVQLIQSNFCLLYTSVLHLVYFVVQSLWLDVTTRKSALT